MTDNRHLRIVEPTPWNRAEAYDREQSPTFGDKVIQRIRARLSGKPVHVRIGWFATLAADARDMLNEVRGSPYSHALVAVLTVVGWTALLVIPTLIGVGK